MKLLCDDIGKFQNAPIDVVKVVYDVCFVPVIQIILQSNDHGELQVIWHMKLCIDDLSLLKMLLPTLSYHLILYENMTDMYLFLPRTQLSAWLLLCLVESKKCLHGV